MTIKEKNSNLILATLGKTIRKYRNELKISQEDFADQCNLHRTYIGSIERGEKNPTFLNIVRIAKHLNIKPSQLMEEIDNLEINDSILTTVKGKKS